MSEINSSAARTTRSAREISINQRRALVEAFLDSSMNQKKFAEKNNISRRAFCRWVQMYNQGKLTPQDDGYFSITQSCSDTVTISAKEYEILLHTYFMYKENIK